MSSEPSDGHRRQPARSRAQPSTHRGLTRSTRPLIGGIAQNGAHGPTAAVSPSRMHGSQSSLKPMSTAHSGRRCRFFGVQDITRPAVSALSASSGRRRTTASSAEKAASTRAQRLPAYRRRMGHVAGGIAQHPPQARQHTHSTHSRQPRHLGTSALSRVSAQPPVTVTHRAQRHGSQQGPQHGHRAWLNTPTTDPHRARATPSQHRGDTAEPSADCETPEKPPQHPRDPPEYQQAQHPHEQQGGNRLDLQPPTDTPEHPRDIHSDREREQRSQSHRGVGGGVVRPPEGGVLVPLPWTQSLTDESGTTVSPSIPGGSDALPVASNRNPKSGARESPYASLQSANPPTQTCGGVRGGQRV